MERKKAEAFETLRGLRRGGGDTVQKNTLTGKRRVLPTPGPAMSGPGLGASPTPWPLRAAGERDRPRPASALGLGQGESPNGKQGSGLTALARRAAGGRADGGGFLRVSRPGGKPL